MLKCASWLLDSFFHCVFQIRFQLWTSLRFSSLSLSLVNKPGWQPLKLDQTGKHSYQRSHSIYSCYNSGPAFGGGSDMYIANNAASSTSSYSNLGYTYSPPSGYSYKSSFSRSFLAGSYYKFRPDEVEVFYETTWRNRAACSLV